MAKQLKTWTTLGLAALGTASLAEALPVPTTVPSPAPGWVLVQSTGGEDAEPAGESGGEGGSHVPSTYALESTDPGAYKYDASAQVAAYATLVRKAYARAAEDAARLQAAVDTFLAAPSEDTLAEARKAWVEARPAYLRTEAFRFYDGPIEEIEANINSWPVNEAYIDYVKGNPASGLVNDAEFPMEDRYLERRNQKHDEADVTVGWHAIEFLLWGQDLSADGPGNRPYTDYIAGQGNNDRRRLYLKTVTDDLAENLSGLEAAWNPEARTAMPRHS